MEAMKPRYRISPFAMQLDFLPALNSIIQPVLNLVIGIKIAFNQNF
jgi:hypothetical protein